MISKLLVPAAVFAALSFAPALAFPPAIPVGQLNSRSQLDAILGSASVTEDFEAFSVPPNEYKMAGFFGPLTSDSVIQGQGPGLVVPGISIQTFGELQWYDTTAFGGNSKRLSFSSGQAYEINFSNPVSAFGFDFTAIPSYSGSSSMYVYDTNGDTVGMFQYALVDNPLVPAFVGYSYPDGIGGIGILTFQGGPVLDNFTFGSVPEPSALVLVGIGLALLLSTRRTQAHAD